MYPVVALCRILERAEGAVHSLQRLVKKQGDSSLVMMRDFREHEIVDVHD